MKIIKSWNIIILFLIFLIALITKILSVDELFTSVAYSNLVRTDYVKGFSYMIIVAEFVVSVSLLFERLRKFGLMLVLILACLFFSYSFWRLINRIPVPCSCFGAMFKASPVTMMIINIGICLLAVKAIVRIDRQKGVL